MDHAKGESLTVGFNGSMKLEFHGAKVTSDVGLLAYLYLNDVLGLFDSVSTVFRDRRTGRNIQQDTQIAGRNFRFLSGNVTNFRSFCPV